MTVKRLITKLTEHSLREVPEAKSMKYWVFAQHELLSTPTKNK